MTFQALDALAADPTTELIVVIGKPPAPAVRARVEIRLRTAGKPCVLAVLGQGVREGREGAVHVVATLEDAAWAALAMLEGSPSARSRSASPRWRCERAWRSTAARSGLTKERCAPCTPGARWRTRPS